MSEQEAKSTALTVGGWLESPQMRLRITNALAGYVDSDVFLASAVLAARDTKLRDCSPAVIFGALLDVAQMGLMPGRHHAHVALIPRNDGRTIEVRPQWQGFKYLMERQPGVKRVSAVLVHEIDEFSWDACEQVMVHRYDPFDPRREFRHPSDAPDGKTGLRGGYVRVDLEDGVVFHFVSAAKIEKSRLCSDVPDMTRKGGPGVWRSWYAEQALKTCYRDAFARRVIPLDSGVEGRLGAVEAAEAKPEIEVGMDAQTEPERHAEVAATRIADKARALTASVVEAEPEAQSPEEPNEVPLDAADPGASWRAFHAACGAFEGDLPPWTAVTLGTWRVMEPETRAEWIGRAQRRER